MRIHPTRFDDAEILELPEEVVAQLSTPVRNRWIELRSFVFRAERLLRKLAAGNNNVSSTQNAAHQSLD